MVRGRDDGDAADRGGDGSAAESQARAGSDAGRGAHAERVVRGVAAVVAAGGGGVTAGGCGGGGGGDRPDGRAPG